MSRPRVTSTCQRAGCMRVIPASKIACDEHWAALPYDVRGQLVDAVSRYGEDSEETGAALHAAVTLLRHPRPGTMP